LWVKKLRTECHSNKHSVKGTFNLGLTRGGSAFYSNTHYVQLCVKAAVFLMETIDPYTLDPICQLFDSLFVNCRGKIDDVYESLLDSLLMRIEKEAKTSEDESMTYLYSTLSLACYYNPRIFIMYGVKKSCLQKVLQIWLSNLDLLNWNGKKNAVFGMSSLLELNPSECPAPLSNEQTTLSLLNKIVDLVIDMNHEPGEDEKADELDGEMFEEKAVDSKLDEEDMEDGEKFTLVDCEKSADYLDPISFCSSLPHLDQVLGVTDALDLGFDLDEAIIETKLLREDENIAFENGLKELFKNNPHVAQKWSDSLDPCRKRLLSKFLRLAYTYIGCMDKREEQERKRKTALRRRVEELLKSNGMAA